MKNTGLTLGTVSGRAEDFQIDVALTFFAPNLIFHFLALRIRFGAREI